MVTLCLRMWGICEQCFVLAASFSEKNVFYNVADVTVLSSFLIPCRFLSQTTLPIAALALRCILIFDWYRFFFFFKVSHKFNQTRVTDIHFFLHSYSDALCFQKYQFLRLFSIQSPRLSEIAVSVCCENAFLTLY